MEDALEIRRRILIAFEAAEREPDPERRRAWMTFVLVGGGPTGVELAGALGEIAHDTLRRDFRSIGPARRRILLVEAMDRVLPTYPPDRSASAQRQLERLGVDRPDRDAGRRPRRGRSVRVVGPDGDRGDDPGPDRLSGRRASSPRRSARTVAEATGAQTDRAGRVIVEPDLTIAGPPGDLRRRRRGGAAVEARPAGAGRRAGRRSRAARYAAQDHPPPAVRRALRRRSATRTGRRRGHRAAGRASPTSPGSGRSDGRVASPPGRSGWDPHLLPDRVREPHRRPVRWAWSFMTHGRGSRLITGKPLLPPIEDPEPPVLAPLEPRRRRAAADDEPVVPAGSTAAVRSALSRRRRPGAGRRRARSRSKAASSSSSAIRRSISRSTGSRPARWSAA